MRLALWTHGVRQGVRRLWRNQPLAIDVDPSTPRAHRDPTTGVVHLDHAIRYIATKHRDACLPYPTSLPAVRPYATGQKPLTTVSTSTPIPASPFWGKAGAHDPLVLLDPGMRRTELVSVQG